MHEHISYPVEYARRERTGPPIGFVAELEEAFDDPGGAVRPAIERPRELESTARGAAMLAGVGTGLFSSALEASVMARPERIFTPVEGPRREMRAAWSLAVRRAMTHADSV